MPLHSRLSFDPSDEPCDLFSLLGMYSTSAIQPSGLIPRMSPRWLPLDLPRPTAAGYSSRSNPALVGILASSRLRRLSAPRRLTIMIFGQPGRSNSHSPRPRPPAGAASQRPIWTVAETAHGLTHGLAKSAEPQVTGVNAA